MLVRSRKLRSPLFLAVGDSSERKGGGVEEKKETKVSCVGVKVLAPQEEFATLSCRMCLAGRTQACRKTYIMFSWGPETLWNLRVRSSGVRII